MAISPFHFVGVRRESKRGGALRHRLARSYGWPGPSRLCLADVCSLEALRPLHDLELQALALGQGLEALAGDGRVMNEHVLTALLLDESETLRLVEPLHSSNRHSLLLANWGLRPYSPTSRVGQPGLYGRASGERDPPRTQKRPQAVAPAACIAYLRYVLPTGNCYSRSIGRGATDVKGYFLAVVP